MKRILMVTSVLALAGCGDGDPNKNEEGQTSPEAPTDQISCEVSYRVYPGIDAAGRPDRSNVLKETVRGVYCGAQSVGQGNDATDEQLLTGCRATICGEDCVVYESEDALNTALAQSQGDTVRCACIELSGSVTSDVTNETCDQAAVVPQTPTLYASEGELEKFSLSQRTGDRLTDSVSVEVFGAFGVGSSSGGLALARLPKPSECVQRGDEVDCRDAQIAKVSLTDFPLSAKASFHSLEFLGDLDFAGATPGAGKFASDGRKVWLAKGSEAFELTYPPVLAPPVGTSLVFPATDTENAAAYAELGSPIDRMKARAGTVAILAGDAVLPAGSQEAVRVEDAEGAPVDIAIYDATTTYVLFSSVSDFHIYKVTAAGEVSLARSQAVPTGAGKPVALAVARQAAFPQALNYFVAFESQLWRFPIEQGNSGNEIKSGGTCQVSKLEASKPSTPGAAIFSGGVTGDQACVGFVSTDEVEADQNPSSPIGSGEVLQVIAKDDYVVALIGAP